MPVKVLVGTKRLSQSFAILWSQLDCVKFGGGVSNGGGEERTMHGELPSLKFPVAFLQSDCGDRKLEVNKLLETSSFDGLRLVAKQASITKLILGFLFWWRRTRIVSHDA